MVEWILVLGIVCILGGVLAGFTVADRSIFLQETPTVALLVSGFVVSCFGLLGLHSYLGFLLYVPGTAMLGLGIGKLARDLTWMVRAHRD
jgi:hypothetical protein